MPLISTALSGRVGSHRPHSSLADMSGSTSAVKRPTPGLLKSTLRRKSRYSFGSDKASPEPPRPPVKSTSPKSRVYGKSRSPIGPERVGGTDTKLTSPSYDPTNLAPYFDQCFEVLDELGQGSYAKVYKARFRDDGKYYAIKKSLRNYSGVSDRKRKLNEVSNLKILGYHPNCVRLYDAWEESCHLYIQMELCEGDNLKTICEKAESGLDEYQLWTYLSDIASGLSHVHAEGYVHMDIKPENIFVGEYNDLKIGDFGIATPYTKTRHGAAVVAAEERDDGDPVYIAPELLDPSTAYFGPAVDVFSTGMTMLDIGSDRVLPGNGSTWKALRSIERYPHRKYETESLCRELLGDRVSDDFVDIIEQMLSKDPTQRPTCEEILRHPKIAEYNKRRQRLRFLLSPYYSLIYVLGLVYQRIMVLISSLSIFVYGEKPVPMITIDGMRQSRVDIEPLNEGLEPVRTRLRFDDDLDSPTDSSRAAAEQLQRRLGDLDFAMDDLK